MYLQLTKSPVVSLQPQTPDSILFFMVLKTGFGLHVTFYVFIRCGESRCQ